MAVKGGYFSFHGGFLHNLVIFICWHKLLKEGWKVTICDRSFADKCCAPCVPDLRITKRDPKITNYIIEVESKLTCTTAHKKWLQFVRENHGYDLVLLNIDDIKNPDSLKSINEYVEGMLP
ncbi:hypothetical protein KAR91_39605 [Candidatus Pacearchaeota archaeon]|nr:hypothetical protein [Candidatus Pacearchaeota archaeon]